MGRGGSDADIRIILAQKTRFFEIYGVSARQGERGQGVEPVRTRGMDQFFAILCGLLLDGPAPKKFLEFESEI